MSNQGDKQASFRAIGGTTCTLEGDMLAAFAADSITTGTLNERLYEWLGNRGVTGTLPERMDAFAAAQGYDSWDAMGSFSISTLLFSAFSSSSNVLSLDASTAAGSATATFERFSTAYAQDLDGVYRQIDSGQERWQGGRYVKNLCLYSADLTQGNWSVIGANTIDDSDSFTHGAGFNDGIRYYVSGHPDTGKPGYVVTRFKMKADDGGTIRLRTGVNTDLSLDDITLTTTYQTFAVVHPVTSTSWATIEFSTLCAAYGAIRTVELTDFQIEWVPGASTQIPGEYQATSGAAVGKWYSTTNGNTIDGSNVLVEADGVALRPTNQPDDGSTDTRYAVYGQWQASTAYSVGDRIIPTDVSEFFCRGLSDVYLECTTAGTTGGTEPTWDRTLTNTTADNTAVWTCTGYYTLKGVLIEGARANLALHARDFTNVVWTATNITAAKDATGADGVGNSASTLTSTAGNGTIFQALTLGSVEYVTSFLVKRKTGTGTIEITDDGGSTYTDITSLIDATNYTLVSTSQTQANPSIGFRIVTSGDAIEVDMAQCDASDVASSPIPTTTGTVTRTAETLTYPWASNVAEDETTFLADMVMTVAYAVGLSTGTWGVLTSTNTYRGLHLTQGDWRFRSDTELASRADVAAETMNRVGARGSSTANKSQVVVSAGAGTETTWSGVIQSGETTLYVLKGAVYPSILLNARIYSEDKGTTWLEGETAYD